jgi:hypothetical protein
VLGNGQAQLRAFADLAVRSCSHRRGYMTDYDPTDEYVYMQQAGCRTRASSPPSRPRRPARFGAGARTGRLAAGLDADVVIFDGNPAEDIRALGRVRATLRAGQCHLPESSLTLGPL